MLERRKSPRRQIFKFGTLRCGDLAKLSVVKNMSSAGAMVAVENSFDVPEEFDLDIEANLLSRRCRVAWKNSKQLGLKFINSIRS